MICDVIALLQNFKGINIESMLPFEMFGVGEIFLKEGLLKLTKTILILFNLMYCSWK